MWKNKTNVGPGQQREAAEKKFQKNSCREFAGDDEEVEEVVNECLGKQVVGTMATHVCVEQYQESTEASFLYFFKVIQWSLCKQGKVRDKRKRGGISP